MKTQARVLFVLLVIVSGAFVVVYLLGQRHTGEISAKDTLPLRQQSVSVSSSATLVTMPPKSSAAMASLPQTVAAKTPSSKSAHGMPRLSAAEARDLFINSLAGKFPKDHNKISGVIAAIVLGINTAEIPELLNDLVDLPDSADKQKLVKQLVGVFAQDDPASALALIYNMPDGLAQYDQTFQFALAKLTKTDLNQALNYLAQLPSDDGTDNARLSYARVFEAMGTKSNAGAIALAEGVPAGPVHDTAMKGLFTGWSMADPKAALDWAASLPATETSVFNADALFAAAVNSHQPAVVAQYVNQLQDAAARDSAIASIALNWGTAGTNKDPVAALNWLNQVTTGENYANAVTNIFTYLAKDDPAAAITALNKVTDPATLQSSITIVAATWGGKNPQAALDWLQTLPQSETRDIAIQQLTRGAGYSP